MRRDSPKADTQVRVLLGTLCPCSLEDRHDASNVAYVGSIPAKGAIMDANKRLKLLSLGYSIQGSCGICQYGNFVGSQSFGACGLHTYQHLKHTEDHRQLSVYIHGRCEDFTLDVAKARLGLWEEFVEKSDG